MKKSILEGEIAGPKIPSRFGMLTKPLESLRKNRSARIEVPHDYYEYRRAEAAPYVSERRGASAVGAWQRQSFNR